MEAIRNLANTNRSSIINVLYIAAFLVVLYYLYKFLIAGSDLEVSLLNTEVPANEPMTYQLPLKNPDVRVKPGGEYTISFWMYITSWDYRAGLAKSVLQIVDTKAPNYSLLTTILYPNENRLMVRVHTEAANSNGVDYTMNNNYDTLMSGKQGLANEVIESPMCDIQDIDLQRWINITISVNGRIVDVYYDGKLNRSCVLPDIPIAPESGVQVVMTGKKGGFGGKLSGIQFFGYPLTPDRIYAIYQAGPQGPAGFMGFLAEKLGIKLTYSGKAGEKQAMAF
jgi:hypothetical protein